MQRGGRGAEPEDAPCGCIRVRGVCLDCLWPLLPPLSVVLGGEGGMVTMGTARWLPVLTAGGRHSTAELGFTTRAQN